MTYAKVSLPPLSSLRVGSAARVIMSPSAPPSLNHRRHAHAVYDGTYIQLVELDHNVTRVNVITEALYKTITM